MKKLLIIVGIFIAGAAGFYLFKNSDTSSPAISGCDQSATTTDCTKIAEMYPSTKIQVEAEGYKWRQYTNNEIGISFSYPSAVDQNWGIGKGDTGKQFGGTIELPSKSTLSFVAHTKDYTAPKGGVMVSTEGYIVKDGKYYVITRGKISDTSFTPDEILKLKDDTPVILVYKKGDYPGSDYQPPDVAAMINLPNGKEFTGIGFTLYLRSYPTPVENPAEDIAAFKRFVTSLEFTK